MEFKLRDEVFDKETQLIGTIIEIQEYSSAAKVEFSIEGNLKQMLIPIKRLIKIKKEDIKKSIEKWNRA